MKQFVRETLKRNFPEKLYGPHVYYGLAWLKLLQQDKRSRP